MPSRKRSGRTKAQQREETTRALVEHARELFASKGYAHTSVAEISAAAGVTKGALFHHFAGKEDLSRAVLRQAHEYVAFRVAAAAPDADAWTQLVEGCRAFLAASTEGWVRQIMLIDGPSVHGWEGWRAIDAATSRQLLEDVLYRLMRDGVIADQPVAPLVSLLSGAMNEAALWLAESDDLERDLDEVMVALTGMLEALRARSA
jgi:AcrR family transcriptional regulator